MNKIVLFVGEKFQNHAYQNHLVVVETGRRKFYCEFKFYHNVCNESASISVSYSQEWMDDSVPLSIANRTTLTLGMKSVFTVDICS